MKVVILVKYEFESVDDSEYVTTSAEIYEKDISTLLACKVIKYKINKFCFANYKCHMYKNRRYILIF